MLVRIMKKLEPSSRFSGGRIMNSCLFAASSVTRSSPLTVPHATSALMSGIS